MPYGPYDLIIYTLRDGGGQPESFTINDDSATTLHVKSEGGGDWNANKAFRRGISTDPANAQLCNYVEFNDVYPVNGTIKINARSDWCRNTARADQRHSINQRDAGSDYVPDATGGHDGGREQHLHADSLG